MALFMKLFERNFTPNGTLKKDVYLGSNNGWFELYLPPANKFTELDVYLYGVKK